MKRCSRRVRTISRAGTISAMSAPRRRPRRRDRCLPAGDHAAARHRRDGDQPLRTSLGPGRAARGAAGGDARGGADRARRCPACRPSSASPKPAARDFAAAEARLPRGDRGSIPHALSAYLELGLLLENLNRIDELAALVAQAEASGLAGAGARLPQGLGAAPAGPVRRGAAARRGDAGHDQPGPPRPAARPSCTTGSATPERAFAAFAEMNRAAVAATRRRRTGPSYRETVAADAALLTPDRVAGWTRIEVEPRRRRRSSSSASRARARPCSTPC